MADRLHARLQHVISVESTAESVSRALATHYICEVVVTMLIAQAGLYAIVFVNTPSQIRVLFWITLGCASFLTAAQLVYMVLFRRPNPSINMHLLFMCVSPCVSFIATWVYTLGTLELLMNASDISLNNASWTTVEWVLMGLGISVFLLILTACGMLFFTHLGGFARTFGHSLSEFFVSNFHWEVVKDDEDEDMDGSNDFPTRSRDDILSISGRSLDELAQTTEATPTNPDPPPSAPSTTAPPSLPPATNPAVKERRILRLSILLCACQIVMIAIQLHSGLSGLFPVVFLVFFSLSACVFAIVLCYSLLLVSAPSPISRVNDSGLELESMRDDVTVFSAPESTRPPPSLTRGLSNYNPSMRGLHRVWASIPLIVLQIDTWCFCELVVHFTMAGESLRLSAVFGNFTALQVVLFALMSVCYLVVLIGGAFTTLQHLNVVVD